MGVSRGCTRGCRFCMAGCMYRPRRETPLKTLLDIAENCRQATGLDRVALIGAAVSDYSQIEDLCKELYERDFQITTPSLRIESVSDELLTILSDSGLRTITIAPESTWRIRKVANKPIFDEDIIRVMDRAVKYDLNVKLYFMMGLPSEEQEDREDLIKLIDRLEEIPEKKSSLRISINPFIPKPHTPFQWMKFDYKELKKEIKFFKSQLKRKNLKIGSPRLALKQYVLSQGNAELGEFIFKSWKNNIPLREWENIAPNWNLDSVLPWDNIDVRIDKVFLEEEYHKALNGDITPWCETFGCYDCGVCDKQLIV
ncbi:MAG: radical SAM protein [Methanobacterium sp.]|nr:radical SAM protein [Methanobacterium sp.]